MPSGHDEIRRVLAHPREKPRRALLRSLLAGIPLALLVGVLQFFTGIFTHASPAAFLLTGLFLSFLLWGADRLWFSMIAPMFRRPFSLAAYCTRLPFWYLAAGIAFEAGVLAAKELGWLSVYEIPVKQLFDAGARLGVAAECIYQGMTFRSVRRTAREPRASELHHE